ncbi:hypothetical protein NL676_014229 [Syzygium grande]|nr:hypothetical protein NL676_014229 [Syzygium grande]
MRFRALVSLPSLAVSWLLAKLSRKFWCVANERGRSPFVDTRVGARFGQSPVGTSLVHSHLASRRGLVGSAQSQGCGSGGGGGSRFEPLSGPDCGRKRPTSPSPGPGWFAAVQPFIGAWTASISRRSPRR